MNIYLGQTAFSIVSWFLVAYMIFCNLYLIGTYIKDKKDRKNSI